jgi:rod shape-determining protein MreD
MFLVLTVLYWSIASPRAGGIALGFFSGLMLDVFQSPVLGEHALALTCITYVAVREHQKIRSKPAFQQSLIVFAVLVAYETLLFFIDGWTHHSITNPLRWVHTLSGAILWAPVAAVLNATNDRRR